MIRRLNPVIRGWAYYHRHIEAGAAFRKVRMAVWYSLWRWATRRQSPTELLAAEQKANEQRAAECKSIKECPSDV
jgi:hypothetical protein